MLPIRVGLLGASWIAEHAILEPARGRTDIVVSAVAARDPTRAARYASAHGIPDAMRDYAALVAREDIDLVYVGLSPVDHCEWTLRSLKAGKHVLCEKPFAMNAEEARRMVGAAQADGRILIEAWHYRFHPLHRRIEEILASGLMGRLRRARAQFDAPIPRDVSAFRWQRALGGGALMDTGGYTIHALRSFIGREPRVKAAAAQCDGDVDVTTTARLDFGEGLDADISCTMVGKELFSELRLEGETGMLIVNGFPLPQWGCRLRVETGAGVREESSFGGTTYEAQLAHVVDVLHGGATPLTGGADAIANMRIIDAVREAANLNR